MTSYIINTVEDTRRRTLNQHSNAHWTVASALLSRTALGGILSRVIGLILALVGAVLLFAGLVGAVFRIVADANVLAAKTG